MIGPKKSFCQVIYDVRPTRRRQIAQIFARPKAPRWECVKKYQEGQYRLNGIRRSIRT